MQGDGSEYASDVPKKTPEDEEEEEMAKLELPPFYGDASAAPMPVEKPSVEFLVSIRRPFPAKFTLEEKLMETLDRAALTFLDDLKALPESTPPRNQRLLRGRLAVALDLLHIARDILDDSPGPSDELRTSQLEDATALTRKYEHTSAKYFLRPGLTVEWPDRWYDLIGWQIVEKGPQHFDARRTARRIALELDRKLPDKLRPNFKTTEEMMLALERSFARGFDAVVAEFRDPKNPQSVDCKALGDRLTRYIKIEGVKKPFGWAGEKAKRRADQKAH